eukprot:CAMPEP_0175893500 /NCGR_PEP_ID=MMETSP0107_2-20121207/49498_1 /TAXON_ID=195067 ORGANISM="Goniomonas pacifica, Strain CCMP1869" /NCGR_SAMPLE_ID=MMETSP0107_2 /ASSEMBLY_ACC=CAM_ASM_000203 /LENGTH=65 /DNA_ID=CAMNT_0017214543 /DNA_START=51 /DNA_END=245 /DNA_ORIENTATION=+
MAVACLTSSEYLFVVPAEILDHMATLCSVAAEARPSREMVLAAVAQDGTALRYASAELQGDREVV